MSTTEPDQPRDRRTYPDAKTLKRIGAGFGFSLLSSIAFTSTLLGVVSEKDWDHYMFPYGLVATVIIFWPLVKYPRGWLANATLPNLRRFNIAARGLAWFYIANFLVDVLLSLLYTVPYNATFVAVAGVLAVFLYFPISLLWSLHHYKWFDPNSRPSEWQSGT
ncbi:hypothetical protein [Acidocella facilis]|uniref:hypothetical protein n=1 Tax=Acidocella facilis TaxID=525 RepID=UPI001F455B4D|nr:hypothetical protein [Acidocella facilis]